MQFFHHCPKHPDMRRNECTFFCTACSPATGRALCRGCLDGHDCQGTVFQIRKYMYQTCIRVEDLAPLTDITGVQAYLINSKRAVLIHPKAASPMGSSTILEDTCRWVKPPTARVASPAGVGVWLRVMLAP